MRKKHFTFIETHKFLICRVHADKVVQTTTIFFEQRNGELRVKQARSDFSVGALKLNFVGARADDPLSEFNHVSFSNASHLAIITRHKI
jgi:hypothetical protein